MGGEGAAAPTWLWAREVDLLEADVHWEFSERSRNPSC